MATILVVEDDPDVLEIIALIAASDEDDIIMAHDGREAIVKLSSQPFDLLITDIVMPVQQGYEVGRFARARHPSIPIIYLSGYSADSLVVRGNGRELGILLAKPVMPADLRREINTALGR